jgi:hypothetical protein
MFFSGKRIVNLSRYFRRANLHTKQYVYFVGNDEESMFSAIGLPLNAAIGHSILPKVVGPISKFNSEGTWIIHKDRSKEDRVVGQRIWRWRQFRGRYGYEDQERIIDVTRPCYPRTFVEPPSVEMSVQVVANQRRLITELGANSSEDEIKHTVNLYLEIFGQCHLTDQPAEVPIVMPTRVNWRMLPPGSDPWSRAEQAVEERTASASADAKFIITERQRFICSLGPSDVYVGEGGFSDYLAYIFTDKNKAVLESVSCGNAIYVFEENWRDLSQLTKREILSSKLHQARIVHATGWPERLHEALR